MRKILIEMVKPFCITLLVLSIIYCFLAEGDYTEWYSFTIVPSLLLFFVLGTLHIGTMKALGAKNDLSAKQSEQFEIGRNMNSIVDLLENSTNWKLKSIGPDKAVFETSPSIKSFGEVIEIRSSGNNMLITSKPVISTTVFDFGKNFQNIEVIKKLLSNELQRR